MKRIFTLLIFIALCLAFLSGCSDSNENSKIVGSYKNMEVIKVDSSFEKFECDNRVELKRGKTTIEICTIKKVKNLLKEGNIVDVYYDRDMFIQKVKFPDFEGDKTND